MIKTPTNQKKLTNVAIVRLQKGKVNFELACYRNKVEDFRAKKETNLSEVLQIDNIYSNVERGEMSNKKDIEKVFGKKINKDDIIKEILNKGLMQVSDKERESK
jgi:ribosome maturation protein SDO1